MLVGSCVGKKSENRDLFTRKYCHFWRKERSFPWASSLGGDFNFDFNVSVSVTAASNTTTSAAATRSTRSRKPGACRLRRHDRNRRGHVCAPKAGHECVRARGLRHLPHLIRLCARTGRPLGHVPVARPRRPPTGATRPASGGATTTSTASAEPGRHGFTHELRPPWAAGIIRVNLRGRYRGPRRMVTARVTFADGWLAALESDCVC
jgi:hypothetical protein